MYALNLIELKPPHFLCKIFFMKSKTGIKATICKATMMKTLKIL